ncbi:MAG: YraN family protein [Proteobacteria bacterium]|nr:MAG: YraN family protein [Pseudomonadota bacterium]
MTTTRLRGQQAEDQACEFLQAQGLLILQRNYQLRSGEIDIICKDQTHLIFVEVRYRRHQQFGGALGSIDWRKQQRIIRTAQHYLLCHPIDLPARFDVITLDTNTEPQWIQNAFTAD